MSIFNIISARIVNQGVEIYTNVGTEVTPTGNIIAKAFGIASNTGERICLALDTGSNRIVAVGKSGSIRSVDQRRVRRFK